MYLVPVSSRLSLTLDKRRVVQLCMPTGIILEGILFGDFPFTCLHWAIVH